MTQTYRLIVHCDENRTGTCHGLVEYGAPDRLRLAEQADEHTANSAWLRGYRAGGTWDVCPACRKLVEAEMAQARPATFKEVFSE